MLKMITEEIIKIEEIFNLYISLLKSLKDIEKADLNDLDQQEEILRLDIITQLNKIKEDFF